jgi:8-oxo-dGTP pyrophosphatase MutT (NUDIX family)
MGFDTHATAYAKDGEIVKMDYLQSIFSPRLPNRTGVRAIVQRKGKYLMVKRLDGRYEFPGGKSDGQPPRTALRREIKEETNLKLRTARQFHTIHEPDRNIWTIYYKAKASGRIKLQPEELSHHRFVTIAQARKLRMTRNSRVILRRL